MRPLGGGSFRIIFMQRQFIHSYLDIISIENLLAAWREFAVGKSQKHDVQVFALHLIDNIIELHNDLANRTYSHGTYYNFAISDPKPRQIHKARVRDRVLHHAIYRLLHPLYDKLFITDSFSCRINKGTHRAMERFQTLAYKASKNHTRTCWVLKCDIKKFFASIDHPILLQILKKRIADSDIIWLLKSIINSFSVYSPGKGLPLGNLTSQLFCNVYMNKFDQFVKHKLHAKYYVRYADDFVFLSDDRQQLVNLIPKISEFLSNELKLSLHPKKIFIKAYASGLDFLGWVHFQKYRTLRTATKKRMLKKIAESPKNATLQSYLGLLSHGNTHDLQAELLNSYWLQKETDNM